MKIVYQDAALAIIEKPQNMPSQPDKSGDLDALTALQYSFEGSKPSYAAIITRLDRGVGGLLLCALNKGTAAKLSQMLAGGSIEKGYTAVACGLPPAPNAVLEHYLLHNQRTNTTKPVTKGIPNAKAARLTYTVAESKSTAAFGTLSLLNIQLHTGRHHQIRAQLSAIGCPLWGDLKYNPKFDKGGLYYKAARDEEIQLFPALWASKLILPHPETGKTLSLSSAPTGYPFTILKQPTS